MRIVEISPQNGINQTVVIFGGRFSPFHKGHFKVYEWCCEKFGKNNVYLATADNKSKAGKLKEQATNPFTFAEKKRIITTMYDIDSSKIIESCSPALRPGEVLKNFDAASTAYVSICGKKDEIRYGGQYFKSLDESKGKLNPFDKNGYFLSAPMMANNLSASKIREGFRNGTLTERKKLFVEMYGKFDKKIFKLMDERING